VERLWRDSATETVGKKSKLRFQTEPNNRFPAAFYTGRWNIPDNPSGHVRASRSERLRTERSDVTHSNTPRQKYAQTEYSAGQHKVTSESYGPSPATSRKRTNRETRQQHRCRSAKVDDTQDRQSPTNVGPTTWRAWINTRNDNKRSQNTAMTNRCRRLCDHTRFSA